jgi:hypothetical protein
LTDDVLALGSREGFDKPLIHRAVLKYALECPGEAAAKHVAAARRLDPQRVADLRTLLEAEAKKK